MAELLPKNPNPSEQQTLWKVHSPMQLNEKQNQTGNFHRGLSDVLLNAQLLSISKQEGCFRDLVCATEGFCQGPVCGKSQCIDKTSVLAPSSSIADSACTEIKCCPETCRMKEDEDLGRIVASEMGGEMGVWHWLPALALGASGICRTKSQ